MKKRFLLITCLMCICFLAGCANNDTFTPMSFVEEGSKVESINIDVSDRKVDVSLSSDDQVHIDYFESDKEFYGISLSDGVLTMKSESNKNWMDFIGMKPSAAYRVISIQVPEDLLKNLSIKNSNENVTVNELSVTGNIIIDSNNGNIAFSNLEVGDSLTLKVKNGNINGSILGTYMDFTITSNIKKGNCNIDDFYPMPNGEKKLNVSANNGNVEIEFI